MKRITSPRSALLQAAALSALLLLAACADESADNDGAGGTDGGGTTGGATGGDATGAADTSAGTSQPDILPPAREHLNAESFTRFDSRAVGPFAVSMTLRAAQPGDIPLGAAVEQKLYALGVNIAGPQLSLAERPNIVLTLLVDVSGSMDSPYAQETRNDVTSLLDVVQYGLQRIGPSLKSGDTINLVTFSNEARIVVEGLDAIAGDLSTLVTGLQTEGSTNIGAGVDLAYEVANRTYDSSKANRVLMLTDARVNTGELDPNRIAEPTTIGGLEGIFFSGIGIGSGFDDTVLNTVTEAGKGSYSAMITPNDAERLFTTDFIRFLSPAARDIRFQLTYPQSLDQLRSFGEEISESPEEVRTVNFAFNSEQFFVELFTGPDALDGNEEITLDITFTDADGHPRCMPCIDNTSRAFVIFEAALTRYQWQPLCAAVHAPARYPSRPRLKIALPHQRSQIDCGVDDPRPALGHRSSICSLLPIHIARPNNFVRSHCSRTGKALPSAPPLGTHTYSDSVIPVNRFRQLGLGQPFGQFTVQSWCHIKYRSEPLCVGKGL